MDKLTDEDKAILATLVDPTEETQTKYPYGDEFIKMLVGTLLCNRFFLSQSHHLIKPEYFTSEIHQLIVRSLFNYYNKYQQIPSRIFLKEIIDEQLKKRYPSLDDNYNNMKSLYFGELTKIYDYYSVGGVGNMMPMLDSPEAILDRITTFAKVQAVKAAFSKSIDLIRKAPDLDRTWEQIDELYREARLINRSVDLGLNYFESLEDRYARMDEVKDKIDYFTTAFRSLDAALMGGGLSRGELAGVMGTAGSGKSLYLTWMSVRNILNGKKVLYISTEMDPDRIATRFDAQFTNIGHNKLSALRNEVWDSLRSQIKGYDDKRRLIVKQFPSGTADMGIIRGYHNQLLSIGFQPDLVVYDYPGDMKEYNSTQGWDSRFRLLREIRGFGVEQKHLSWVAVHPNRTSKELGIEECMDESNQADSYKQFNIFDLFLTLNQVPSENLANVGRGYAAKVRNGKSKFKFFIKYHFADQTLKLEEISKHTYAMAVQNATEKAVDDVDIDKVSIERPEYTPSDGELV